MTVHEFSAQAAIKGLNAEPTDELMARVMWTQNIMIRCGYKLDEASAIAAKTHLMAS